MYRQCLIEDLMVISIGTPIMILIPSKSCDDHSIWLVMQKNKYSAFDGIMVLSKIKYFVFVGSVLTNPQIDKVKAGWKLKM